MWDAVLPADVSAPDIPVEPVNYSLQLKNAEPWLTSEKIPYADMNFLLYFFMTQEYTLSQSEVAFLQDDNNETKVFIQMW